MARTTWWWPGLILISVVSIGLVTLADVQLGVIRPLLAAWFLLICPGMAFVRLFQLRDTLIQWTLAIGLSLTLDALVAGIMLYAGVWSPTWALIILMVISVTGVLLQVLRIFFKV